MIDTNKEVVKKTIETVKLTHQDKMLGMALRLLRGMLIGIDYALEAKDEYSERHSERVAEMCRRFSQFLGNREVVTEQIYLAAVAHDIGKIGIPDSVLLEPGKLNEEQWECMKKHPAIGASILDKSRDAMAANLKDDGLFLPIPQGLVDDVHTIRDGVLHHHEKWNGKGYPDSLSGEDIPYISRVIALCDSTDAMLSKRCYRNSLPVEICKNEISKNAGIMYDPKLTKVFMEHFDEITESMY